MAELENKHPKVTIGVSGAVVLSILLMGGQLTYNLGKQSQRIDATAARIVEDRAANILRQAQFVTQTEYNANNEAVMRELARMNNQLEQISRHLRGND